MKSSIIDYIFAKDSNEECNDPKVLALMETMEKYAKLRKATDATVAVPLIQELKANSFEQVGCTLRKKSEVNIPRKFCLFFFVFFNFNFDEV